MMHVLVSIYKLDHFKLYLAIPIFIQALPVCTFLSKFILVMPVCLLVALSMHTDLGNTETGSAIFNTSWMVGQNCAVVDDIKASALYVTHVFWFAIPERARILRIGFPFTRFLA